METLNFNMPIVSKQTVGENNGHLSPCNIFFDNERVTVIKDHSAENSNDQCRDSKLSIYRHVINNFTKEYCSNRIFDSAVLINAVGKYVDKDSIAKMMKLFKIESNGNYIEDIGSTVAKYVPPAKDIISLKNVPVHSSDITGKKLDFSIYDEIYPTNTSHDKTIHKQRIHQSVSSLSTVKEEQEYSMSFSSDMNESNNSDHVFSDTAGFGATEDVAVVQAEKRHMFAQKERTRSHSFSSDSGISGDAISRKSLTSLAIRSPGMSLDTSQSCRNSYASSSCQTSDMEEEQEILTQLNDVLKSDCSYTSNFVEPHIATALRSRRKVQFDEQHRNPSNLLSVVAPPASSPTNGDTDVPHLDVSDTDSYVSSMESEYAQSLSPTSSTESPSQTQEFPATDKDNMTCFSEPSDSSDLVLVAEGEKFYVHWAVVAWQCNRLLSHLEKTEATEVELLDQRADDLRRFLQLLYPFYSKHINGSDMECLLELAEYMGCERVRRMCTSFLIGLSMMKNLCPHKKQKKPTKDSPDLTNRMFGNEHFNFENSNDLCSSKLHKDCPSERTPTQKQPNVTTLCACAHTMGERTLRFLQLASKYGLDDVYTAFVDVASSIRTSDLVVCPTYSHLSSALREDILKCRVNRLQSVLDHMTFRKCDILLCHQPEHASDRIQLNGDVCLRCTSRRCKQNAIQSTGLPLRKTYVNIDALNLNC